MKYEIEVKTDFKLQAYCSIFLNLLVRFPLTYKQITSNDFGYFYLVINVIYFVIESYLVSG